MEQMTATAAVRVTTTTTTNKWKGMKKMITALIKTTGAKTTTTTRASLSTSCFISHKGIYDDELEKAIEIDIYLLIDQLVGCRGAKFSRQRYINA